MVGREIRFWKGKFRRAERDDYAAARKTSGRVQLPLEIHEDLNVRLKDVAALRGVSVFQVVRDAITEYLDRQGV